MIFRMVTLSPRCRWIGCEQVAAVKIYYTDHEVADEDDEFVRLCSTHAEIMSDLYADLPDEPC